MIQFFVCIGNSDDKLTQQRWSDFCEQLMILVNDVEFEIVGEWYSLPGSPYQNMCASFMCSEIKVSVLKYLLGVLANEFSQDSIALATTNEVEFIHGS